MFFRRFINAGLADDWYHAAKRTNELFEEVDGGEVFSMVMNLPRSTVFLFLYTILMDYQYQKLLR